MVRVGSRPLPSPNYLCRGPGPGVAGLERDIISANSVDAPQVQDAHLCITLSVVVTVWRGS